MRILIPVLTLTALLAGCKTPLTVETLIHADSNTAATFAAAPDHSLESFAADVFSREQRITPTDADRVFRRPNAAPSIADPKPWAEESSFSTQMIDDGDDTGGTIRFLGFRAAVPSSPRARAILDADRQLRRAGIPSTSEITQLRQRALLTLRNERLTAPWIARGLPAADTERIAFAMLFAPDENSRYQAFTLFRTYLIRSPEPMEPFINGLKAALEAEAPFLDHYKDNTSPTPLPDAPDGISLEKARELLDADITRQHELDYLTHYQSQESLFHTPKPYPIALTAALNTFYHAQCQDSGFRLTDPDLKRVIHQMLTNPAWYVRNTAFIIFQRDVLRGYAAESIVSLIEETARERIVFAPDSFISCRKNGDSK